MSSPQPALVACVLRLGTVLMQWAPGTTESGAGVFAPCNTVRLRT